MFFDRIYVTRDKRTRLVFLGQRPLQSLKRRRQVKLLLGSATHGGVSNFFAAAHSYTTCTHVRVRHVLSLRIPITRCCRAFASFTGMTFSHAGELTAFQLLQLLIAVTLSTRLKVLFESCALKGHNLINRRSFFSSVVLLGQTT